MSEVGTSEYDYSDANYCGWRETEIEAAYKVVRWIFENYKRPWTRPLSQPMFFYHPHTLKTYQIAIRA